jgi:hypothetical protein
VQKVFAACGAEYSSDRHVIFKISRSEIVKMTCLSKHNSALRADLSFERDMIFEIALCEISKIMSLSK